MLIYLKEQIWSSYIFIIIILCLFLNLFLITYDLLDQIHIIHIIHYYKCDRSKILLFSFWKDIVQLQFDNRTKGKERKIKKRKRCNQATDSYRFGKICLYT